MNQTEKGKGITMGKQGDLWDDSALINAFDHAISSYKKMHGRESNDGSAYKGEGVSSNGDQVLDGVGGNVEARSQGDANKESNYASNTATEVEQSSNLTPVCVDSHVHESFPQGAHDVPNGNSYSQGAEDYNQLLNQYYEIEEKRQKILEQLHQYGSWNYQCSGEGSGYGSTFQEHSLPENQTSNANVICSCCPYACQCLVASCTSAPACCLGRSYACNSCTVASMPTDPGKSFPLESSDIVKTAMGAAERAISSMVLKTSGDSNADLENKEREKENKEGVMDESTSSETDLTILLNAWYSAGFYTGKYLVEQSIAKRQQS